LVVHDQILRVPDILPDRMVHVPGNRIALIFHDPVRDLDQTVNVLDNLVVPIFQDPDNPPDQTVHVPLNRIAPIFHDLVKDLDQTVNVLDNLDERIMQDPVKDSLSVPDNGLEVRPCIKDVPVPPVSDQLDREVINRKRPWYFPDRKPESYLLNVNGIKIP
jgi:hypothetical protein